MLRRGWMAVAVVLGLGLVARAAELSEGFDQKGNPQIKSAGPITFGPEGILFLGDPKSATIFAIETGDTKKATDSGPLKIEGLEGKLASLLGAPAKDILVADLAVNPISGNAYLSVSRGRGPDATPVLVVADRKGNLSTQKLDNVRYAKVQLPNPPQGDNPRSGRMESITDLQFIDSKLIVAGLSNEEFASKLRSIPFPFRELNSGTSVEIYHGSHGRLETRSPIRTMTGYVIGNQLHLLAAYTCTPLVKLPVAKLDTDKKIKGTTVAELGNHNRPLDMFVYEKDGKDYCLMANSARGMMKIDLAKVDAVEPISTRVPDKAGLAYQTLDQYQNVEQLDRLGDKNALVLINNEGKLTLESIELP